MEENSLKLFDKKFDWKQKELKSRLLFLTFATEKQNLKQKRIYFHQKQWQSRISNCHLSDSRCPCCRPSSVVQLHVLPCLKTSFPLTCENHCFWETWLTGQNGGMRKINDSFPKDLAQHFQNQRHRFWLDYCFQWKKVPISAKMPLKSEWLFYYILRIENVTSSNFVNYPPWTIGNNDGLIFLLTLKRRKFGAIQLD